MKLRDVLVVLESGEPGGTEERTHFDCRRFGWLLTGKKSSVLFFVVFLKGASVWQFILDLFLLLLFLFSPECIESCVK